MPADTDQPREYLAVALRTARSLALEAGADRDAITASLQERLRRLSDTGERTPGHR